MARLPEVKSRLTEFRWTLPKLVAPALSFALLIITPVVQTAIYSRIWQNGTRAPIDRTHCRNHCWDTIFKGDYERFPAGYHHVYFNSNRDSWYIWILIVSFVLIIYECVKYLVGLYNKEGYNIAFLFPVIFSFYVYWYTFWMHFGYINDNFRSQLFHQSAFTLTELGSTIALFRLVDKSRQMRTSDLLWVLYMNFCHVYAGGLDQFITHNILMKGANSQILRNWGLMGPDLLCCAVAIRYLYQRRNEVNIMARENRPALSGFIAFLIFYTFLMN